MKQSTAAMVIAGLFVAGPSMATDVRQYIEIAPPVHMAHDTRNSQTLYCPNGDFAISAGRWPRKDLLRALRFHRVSAHRAKTNRALACILWGLRVQRENPHFGK